CFDSVDLYCRLLAICFLFSCIAPTRHLPSFPTRRSSDLIDAIKAASQPHHFLSVTKGGHSAIVSTAGNNDCHVILRGGKVPNYDAQNIDAACQATIKAGLRPRIMVDASHANSNKDYKNQPLVLEDVAGQMEAGDERIFGVMIESNVVGGRQHLTEGHSLTYGQSITDVCIDLDSFVA